MEMALDSREIRPDKIDNWWWPIWSYFIDLNNNNLFVLSLAMFNKLLEIIDSDDEEQSVFGLLRTIRFDVDPDEKKKLF